MFRRFTTKSPSAVLLLNATSPANFNKSSSLFPVLQSASSCCPVLVTESHNISSSSFTSSCFIAPTPVLLKPSLKQNSSKNNKKKESASSSENKMDDLGKEFAEMKLKLEPLEELKLNLEASQREILQLLRQSGKTSSPCSPTNKRSSSVSKNVTSSSFEWMKEIRSDTKKFDEYLKPETTEIPSNVVSEFYIYLREFVRVKHPKSQFHATVARDGLLWLSKFVHNDAESVDRWCRGIWSIIYDKEKANRKVFGTEQVRDAFVGIAEFATTSDDALENWCSAIWMLTLDNEFNQKLFGTTEILNCFVSFSKVMSPSFWSWWCKSLSQITELKENQQNFGTEEFRHSMIRTAKFVEDADDRDEWLYLLKMVTDNESNKKLFLVGALKDEKERIEKIQ